MHEFIVRPKKAQEASLSFCWAKPLTLWLRYVREVVGSNPADTSFQSFLQSDLRISSSKLYSAKKPLPWRLNLFVQGTVTGTAKKMRLSDYVLQRVMTRDVPKPVSTRNPAILMKLDIEGSELEVLTDMIVSGGLQVKFSNKLQNYDTIFSSPKSY